MGVLVVAHVFFAVASIPLALIDQKTHRLPDSLTLPLWALSALAVGFVAGSGDVQRAEGALFTSALIVSLLWLMAEAPGKPLGFGDVKLGGIIGAQLGCYGVELALFVIMLAFVIGGMVAISLLATKRVNARQHIAFGPYLCIATLLGFTWWV